MQTTTLPAPADIHPSAEIAAAARSLVHARDGIVTILLHLAEQTACGTYARATEVISPLLAALTDDERRWRAHDLVFWAQHVHAPWTDDPDRRDPSEATDYLRQAALQAADRVIHVLRVDACLCREVTR